VNIDYNGKQWHFKSNIEIKAEQNITIKKTIETYDVEVQTGADGTNAKIEIQLNGNNSCSGKI
jgi:VCBS repeat-containing protein